MAAAERDASAVLLLILLTALRLKPAGPRVAFLSGWWGRVLKGLVCLLALRGMRGECNIEPKYAVGATLAALCLRCGVRRNAVRSVNFSGRMP